MGEFVIEGYDRRMRLIIGKTLLEHILELGIDINASCGGVGDCKNDEDIYVVIPERKFTIWAAGKSKEVELDPFVKAIPLYGNRVHWQTRDLGIYRGELYGIALDIGTTTLSMYCVDLETGKNVLILSRENPQIKFGNDVVLRITYARNKGQTELEQDIRRGVLPQISGFIGADNLGVIIATELHKGARARMAIDIGTNTEIVIGNEDRLIATSCASGPAFEGVGITWGIGGVGGAIKNVSIDEGLEVHYETINDLPPIGICGSGLIDILAQMLDREIVDWRGRFTDNREEFVIVKRNNPITISEEDIDKLKLAKAAIALGIKVMIERYGIDLGMLDTLHLAGGFGNFMNVENARKIGMLPNLPLEKIDKVGNAAIEGSREVLLSRSKRSEAEALAKRIEHISLASLTDFSYRYMGELPFKRYQPS